MRFLSRCFLCTLTFAGACSAQQNNLVFPIKDAPFSTTEEDSYIANDSWQTSKENIARASDGSVYAATFYRAGEFEGSINRTTLRDAASHCKIEIHPFHSHLTTDATGHLSGPTSGLSIGLGEDIPKAMPRSLEEVRNRNLQLQQNLTESPQDLNPDARQRQSSLGQRAADGMTLFGYRLEQRVDGQVDRIEEYWDSSLGFTFSKSATRPGSGQVSTAQLTNLKLAEPPAEWFTVQAKYFPPTDIFAKARTAFVSPFSGHEDLQKQLESILAASGRLTVVPDAKTADLLVELGPVPSPPNHGTDPDRLVQLKFLAPPGAKLAPFGDNLMRVMLRFTDTSEKWATDPVVNTCFANLWGQIEHLPLSPGKSGSF